ncbi:hypothetical protein [uncultured Gammaproteobacteria bacterium]|nr:hypothetical protein [uncultured Gammaproteobacteria bacterium]
MLAVFLFANCVNKDNAQNFNSTNINLSDNAMLWLDDKNWIRMNCTYNTY